MPFLTKDAVQDFDDVVFARRTRYGGTPLSRENLAALLWRTAYCLQDQPLDQRIHAKRKPVISAGARHPIDIIVIERSPSMDLSTKLYDDLNHSLLTLDIASGAVRPLWDMASMAAKGTCSTLCWFVAQVGKTAGKYEWPDSLIWRDAGALLQQFSLVSHALSLGCVPLGPTGNPGIDDIFRSNGTLFGVGGCFVSELQA
ncbi:hypothetical protein D3871_00335 [Noviherbaspirillum saxi]|uniref:Nitroreductase family protein n=1 Tax=Noviherbaspirillum saxi TaxID=2320863 RepID=A0A3A3FLV2_9BURK|nr:hypothetical protein D3871_00335 [Noviherbaspirillum saxi]